MSTEQEKAELSRKRGALAANIPDQESRKKFIAAQGEADKRGGKDADYIGVIMNTGNEEVNQALRGDYATARAARSIQ